MPNYCQTLYELANALRVNRHKNSRCTGALPDDYTEQWHRETTTLHISRARAGKRSRYECVLNVRAGAIFWQGDCHRKAAVDYGARRFLFVFLNSRLITELQIDKRISDGKIYVPSGLTAADLEVMKKDWRLIGRRKR